MGKVGNKGKKKKVTKAIMASAAIVVAAGPVVNVQEAKAASSHVWNKYEAVIASQEWASQTFLTWSSATNFAIAVGGNVTTLEDDEGTGLWYVVNWLNTTYKKGQSLGTAKSSQSDAFPSDGIHSDGFYYVYKGANSPPSTPSLNVPPQQFVEHGDRHYISFPSNDSEGDSITYTLQALYNSSWTTIYTGSSSTYLYTVPSNQSQVQFRAMASDGQETSSYATSTVKTIREVQYQWNKFDIQKEYTFDYRNIHGVEDASGMWTSSVPSPEFKVAFDFTIVNGRFELVNPFTPWPVHMGDFPEGKEFYTLYGGSLTYNQVRMSGYPNNAEMRVFSKTAEQSDIKANEIKGNFISSLSGGINAYTHGEKNADGYWYERGQRVLSEDVTPPIIELTEQKSYGQTSTVEVRVHDLSAIKNVKYTKGEQAPGYFATNGTAVTDNIFTVNENGKYTVYAEDAKGNKAVQTIDVKKVNSAPKVDSVNTFDKFNVVDDTTNFAVHGRISDVDGQPMSVKANYNGKTALASVVENTFEATLNGSEYENGFHLSAISIVANDGFTDSEAKTFTHPVIKVDNAADYKRDLNAHSENPDDYTTAQHEAFYNAYKSVLDYETHRTAEAIQTAIEKMDSLKAATVLESDTLTGWQNRLDLVTATVATENAEKNLLKTDFEKAKVLVEALITSDKKDELEERINELQRYHDANDDITAMEDERGNVSWNTINEAQAKVNVVENAENKKALQDRLTQVVKDYMSDLTTITPEDLENFGVTDVLPEHSDLYDELKDEFQPLGEDTNAQNLVDFVNALKVFMSDVTTSSNDTFHSKVPVNASIKLLTTVKSVDSILDYRQVFKRDANRDKALSDVIQDVPFKLTNQYMNTLITAMQEVIEYNDTHDATEKSEGHKATEALWIGQLRTDMQAYLDNGIPDIIVLDDIYEYINNGTLNVVSSIQDTNDTTHNVAVSFNGKTKQITTTDGKINVSFDLADGVYEDYITIVAKDKLTEKTYVITNKPVVVVSDVEMFKRFVQALETDLNQSFDTIELTTISTLKTLFDKTMAIQVNVSSERQIREVENEATKLGGKNGHLETLVKSLVQNNRLIWLINNYKLATDDDFTWAGVVGVTPGNIEGLKVIIDDYVASHQAGKVKTPTIEDYQNWLNLNAVIKEAEHAIEKAEGIHIKEALGEALTNAELSLEKVPGWLSAKKELRDRLDAAIAYYGVIDSVMTAEVTYLQADKDTAQALVDKLAEGTPKDNLNNRLEAVQTVIDAIVGVEWAESTLEKADQVTAQALVDAIDATNLKKIELQSRLDALIKLKEAIVAVEQAETTKILVDKEAAQILVDALPAGPKKEELENRLSKLQAEIDNKSKEDQAKDAVGKAEDSLKKEDKEQAQEKVNALEDGALKNELQERLDALEEHVDAYLVAEEAVEQAEKSKESSDIEAAQALVDVLPDSKAKDSLNERLDTLNKFIEADKAVVKAEISLMQKHKNEAQVLVDALPNNVEKQTLQARLDSLQIAIDNKVKDLLDKIINDLDNVTAEELADYTDQEVYEELMPEYQEEIGKLGDSVTKEQVIEVVKVINAIEFAKREMLPNYIAAYEKEYAASTLPTLHSYPQPTALSSVVDYLHDDNALEKVIQEIAVALKVSEEKIRAELEGILEDVSDDASTGNYLIQYVDEDGKMIYENWVLDVAYGEVVVIAEAPEGYEVVGDNTQSFTLSDDTANQTITFGVKESLKEEGEPKPETGESTEGEDGEPKPETQENNLDAIEINALTIEALNEMVPGLTNVDSDNLALYIQHVQAYANDKGVATFTNDELMVVLDAIHAAYEQGIEAETKISMLDNGTVKDTLMALIKPKQTIGQETALVRSKMLIASLNDDFLRVTATPYSGTWGTENENHAEYVFKTFYALASVKAYKENLSEKYQEDVKSYITVNLHDGSYKEMLLSELGYRIDEIGTTDDGKPDLTPVYPTEKPPVVVPPVDPPVIDPPVTEPPVVNPQPKPEPPPVVVPPETGTVAETIDHEEGKWIIKNPANDYITLEQDGVKITVPFELKAKEWQVEWTNKGNNHYKLRVFADGNEINSFKQNIEVEKVHKKAYVLRYENDKYTSVPFKYEKSNISFKTKRTGEFYFSTKIVKFKDIEGVFSKNAIEELANRQIVFGTSEGYYSPYKNLTRAQFSSMLARALGIEATGTNAFKDVKAKDWFADDVQALFDAGIIKGVTTTKFNPYGTLTRQQAALMLDRALDYLEVEKGRYSPTFSDSDKISDEAWSAVGTMQALGIFDGKANNNFDPYENITRAQMAKVLLNTLEKGGLF
ncbi:S-layer homology domain-containing protein [Lysinibacillus sp. UGB7]|uniref:S-layer homology domain-containing protein n=1 Tax=Lysinibacillus sp. UGB7 TaxID=3411039 RepID=UPI003B815B67